MLPRLRVDVERRNSCIGFKVYKAHSKGFVWHALQEAFGVGTSLGIFKSAVDDQQKSAAVHEAKSELVLYAICMTKSYAAR